MNNEFDIAIVGMAGRFPGARNVDEFWHNLAEGVESITRFSDQEILEAGVPASYVSNPTYVKAAPILDEPGHFDATFFGFSPMEARSMDPQHRILLELAYEALENAGYDSDRYQGRIGVFTGAALNTYFTNVGLNNRLAEEYIPTLIGNDKDFLSTRISYKLNLKGPSITVQTACSTSMVAVHLARQSLLSEEIDMALAGAISVRVPQRAGYFCDAGGVVSPDGHVRAFDAKANGTVFGSGGGILVLKRLADAIADGDTIHAVIKGSAVNNDGSEKAGYTAPSVNSQADAVVEALANAGVEADSISYIEAHGSGTPVGDPIEICALTKAFRTFTQRSGYCAIGSVKTNVGHLDAAAGCRRDDQDRPCARAPETSTEPPLQRGQSRDRFSGQPVLRQHALARLDQRRPQTSRRDVHRDGWDERARRPRRSAGTGSIGYCQPASFADCVGQDGNGSRPGHASFAGVPGQ